MDKSARALGKCTSRQQQKNARLSRCNIYALLKLVCSDLRARLLTSVVVYIREWARG